jgi:hypothetical protein
MKRKIFAGVIFVFLTAMLFCDDYKWEMVNALIYGDINKVEKIINENISSITAPEKQLIMNFILTYSFGEITFKSLEQLLKYSILSNSFDLYTAINRNQSDAVIQLLLDNGSRPNGEILLLAMERQKFNYAKQFIEAGVDVNYQYPSSSNYADSMTPLLYASRWNNFELVNLLINKGANINSAAKDGSTALSIAKKNGNSQIYNFLQECGAAEYVGNNIQPSKSAGISGILDNQAASFLTGTYRLSGRNIEIKFSGDSNSGSVNYTLNGRAGSGIYRIYSNNLTVTMEGQNFLYKVDTNYTFSGNGEVWVRTGN